MREHIYKPTTNVGHYIRIMVSSAPAPETSVKAWVPLRVKLKVCLLAPTDTWAELPLSVLQIGLPRKNSFERFHWVKRGRRLMFITALFIIARTWKQPRCPSADEWIRKLWYIYTMEYYSAIKKNSFESVLMRWMKLEPIIQSKVSQKDKDQYSILTHIYGI